jgi:phosphoribosylanthranilate isomerase
MTPLVKVCGVTRPEDAALAVELGADLVGLNFHPPSPRYLDPARDARRIREIAAAVGGRALLVGVFVDLPAERVEAIAASAGLDLVQLHGDEGPEVAARFGRLAIRVFRGASIDRARMAAEIALYPHAWGFLFDAPRRAGSGDRPDPYGGTGESWDHGAVRNLIGTGALGRPVLVAGGIRPGNARAALAASGARGIDVCSGVESAPGVKDADCMRRLFEEVRHGHAAP